MQLRPDAIRDVLLEVAAERDVQHLRAAADREHRHVALQRRLHQLQLEVVALANDAVRLGMRLGAVQLRIEIRAAGEHQPVDDVQRLRQRRRPAGRAAARRPPRDTART